MPTIVEIPVQSTIKKYILFVHNKTDNSFKNPIVISSRYVYETTDNGHYARKYFGTSRKNNYPTLWVQLPSVTSQKKYAFVQSARIQFRKYIQLVFELQCYAEFSPTETTRFIIKRFKFSEDDWNFASILKYGSRYLKKIGKAPRQLKKQNKILQ